MRFLEHAYYTLDKIHIVYELKTIEAQRFMNFLNIQGLTYNITEKQSNKLAHCRFNFYVDLPDDTSFYIGVEPNHIKPDSFVKHVKVEYNPSKISDPLIGLVLTWLNLRSKATSRQVKRFDLAIDMPIARNKITFLKDNRIYKEYSRSSTDKTQYLGTHNTHGFVKLYNKFLELTSDERNKKRNAKRKETIEMRKALQEKAIRENNPALLIPVKKKRVKDENPIMEFDLTRLEITIDYELRQVDELNRLIPEIYILDDYHFTEKMTGTDKVLMIAILSDITLLNELPRKKKEKIKSFLQEMKVPFQIDEVKYTNILKEIKEIVNKGILMVD